MLRFAVALAVSLSCAPQTARAAEGSKVTPERVQSALEKLATLTNQTLESTGVPGIAIAVVHNDRVVYAQGFGVREAGKPERIDADTVFQVASMSKPIAATVLAALVGENQIGWDDRVIDHDTDFRMFDPFVTRELTLRDLLCHRSGLPDHGGDLLEDMGYSRGEILHRLRYLPPSSSFRSAYAYTNFGFSEAGFAAAKACGTTWEDLAAAKLFKPLGMTSTSYHFADFEKANNRAVTHMPAGTKKWAAEHVRQPDAQAPAGGASSTLKDLSLWMRMLLADGKFDGRQVIAASALAETHTPQFVLGFNPEQGRVSSYGLGWNVSVERGGRAFYRHSGAFALGVRTEVSLLPSENLAITVLSNAAPTGIPEGLTESFFDLVLDGKLQRDWVEFANRMFDEEVKRELGQSYDYSQRPREPSPALKLSTYAGKYANDFFGPIEIVEKAGGLALRMGPKPLEFALQHWDRDIFTYQPVGENAGGFSGVTFTVGPGSQVDRVLIENLNIHGQGALMRVK